MVNRVGSNVFQKVEIKYKDKTVNVRFEKGCIFENKAKKYVVDNNGDLSVFDKSTKTWSRADYIGMTEYQFNAFRAMANNKFEDKDVITYSKEDIKNVMEEQGFTVTEGEYGITAEKGKFTFNFNKHYNYITIRVEVTNRLGIVF